MKKNDKKKNNKQGNAGGGIEGMENDKGGRGSKGKTNKGKGKSISKNKVNKNKVTGGNMDDKFREEMDNKEALEWLEQEGKFTVEGRELLKLSEALRLRAVLVWGVLQSVLAEVEGGEEELEGMDYERREEWYRKVGELNGEMERIREEMGVYDRMYNDLMGRVNKFYGIEVMKDYMDNKDMRNTKDKLLGGVPGVNNAESINEDDGGDGDGGESDVKNGGEVNNDDKADIGEDEDEEGWKDSYNKNEDDTGEDPTKAGDWWKK